MTLITTERLAELGAENINLPEGRRFIGWLEYFKFSNHKYINVTINGDDVFGVTIYTVTNAYAFRITKTYLGCTAATRMPRAGEDWTRGNDLPDGKFTKETLTKILGAILFYESQKVVDLTIPSPFGPPAAEATIAPSAETPQQPSQKDSLP
jgi:hypothetical protein